MTIENIVQERAGHQCELCSSDADLSMYEVPASPDATAASCVLVCGTCRGQIEDADTMDQNHWRCLNESMWSQVPAVQVMAYRMLKRLSGETWAQDLLDMNVVAHPIQRFERGFHVTVDLIDLTDTCFCEIVAKPGGQIGVPAGPVQHTAKQGASAPKIRT